MEFYRYEYTSTEPCEECGAVGAVDVTIYNPADKLTYCTACSHEVTDLEATDEEEDIWGDIEDNRAAYRAAVTAPDRYEDW